MLLVSCNSDMHHKWGAIFIFVQNQIKYYFEDSTSYNKVYFPKCLGCVEAGMMPLTSDTSAVMATWLMAIEFLSLWQHDKSLNH